MDLGPLEIVVIAGVVLVLFGSKKLPDAARSLGRSMRIFKAETRGMKEDERAADAPVVVAPVTPSPTPTEQVVVNGTPARVEHDTDRR